MKKLLLLFCLLPMLAAIGFAQESRQDASISYLGTYQPTITGNAVTQTNDWGTGRPVKLPFHVDAEQRD